MTHLRPAPDPAPEPQQVPLTPQDHRANAPQPGRLSIHRLQVLSQDLGVVATIGLSSGGQVFNGTAEGAATTTSIHRCIALATLRAAESAVGARARFELDHIDIAIAGREQTALSVVTMVTRRGSERLSGASVVRDDVRQAVIRSVLAAINRSLSTLLEPS